MLRLRYFKLVIIILVIIAYVVPVYSEVFASMETGIHSQEKYTKKESFLHKVKRVMNWKLYLITLYFTSRLKGVSLNHLA